MIKQITLYNHTHSLRDNKSGPRSRIWYLCGREIREYFDLPTNCGRVTFTAYKWPGVNRVKFELTITIRNNGEHPRVYIDGQPQYNFQTLTKKAIVKLLKRHGTFYVGCEYE